VQKTPTVGIRKGDLQHAFPLDILMISSSTLTVTGDGVHLTCGGFSLSETVHFRSLEFIVDFFSGMCLSPRRNDSDAAFMGSTRCEPLSPLRAMTKDSTEEFHMVLSGPSPRRHGIGAPPTPIATTSLLEDAPATQAITTVSL
jgi:hypothetical protein